MAIIRWDPFREMTSLQSQVSRLADSMWSGRQESWLPAVDVFDTADAVVLKAELPGLKVDDIQIEVDDNVLTLKGERTFAEKLDEERLLPRGAALRHRSSAASPCRRASSPTRSGPLTRTASSR